VQTPVKSGVLLLVVAIAATILSFVVLADSCSIVSQSPGGSVEVGRSYDFKITIKFSIDSPGSLRVNWVEGMNAYSQTMVSSEELSTAGSYTRTISYSYTSPCNKVHNLIWFNVVLVSQAHGTFTRPDGKTPRTGWYTKTPSAIQPKINIPSLIRANVLASLSDGTSHSEAISARKWLINGVEAGGSKTLSYEFPHDGTYQVELAVQDVCTSEWSSTITTVHVQPEFEPPTGRIFYTPFKIYVGQEISFSARGLQVQDGRTVHNIEWDFGDGTTATGNRVKYTYAFAGRYRVTLRLTDDRGLVTTVRRFITVNVPGADVSGADAAPEKLYISFSPGKSRSASLEAKQVDSSNHFIAVYTPHVADDWGGLYQGFSISGFPKKITGDSLMFEYKLTSRAIQVFVEIVDKDSEYFVYPLNNIGKPEEWHQVALRFSDFQTNDNRSPATGNRLIDHDNLQAVNICVAGLHQANQSTSMEIRNMHFGSSDTVTKTLGAVDFYSIDASSGGGADITAREISQEDGLGWEGVLVKYTPRVASGWQDLYSEIVLMGFPSSYNEAVNAQSLLITYSCDNADLDMGIVLFEKSGEGHVYNIYKVWGNSKWHTLVAPFSFFNYDAGYSMEADDNGILDPEKIDSMRIYMAGMNQIGVTTNLRIKEVQLTNDIPTDEEYLPGAVSASGPVEDVGSGVGGDTVATPKNGTIAAKQMNGIATFKLGLSPHAVIPYRDSLLIVDYVGDIYSLDPTSGSYARYVGVGSPQFVDGAVNGNSLYVSQEDGVVLRFDGLGVSASVTKTTIADLTAGENEDLTLVGIEVLEDTIYGLLLDETSATYVLGAYDLELGVLRTKTQVVSSTSLGELITLCSHNGVLYTVDWMNACAYSIVPFDQGKYKLEQAFELTDYIPRNLWAQDPRGFCWSQWGLVLATTGYSAETPGKIHIVRETPDGK